jgi:hypothetical protein
MEEKVRPEFINYLAEKYMKSEYVIIAPYISNFSKNVKAPSLLRILGLPENKVKDSAFETLKYLNDTDQNELIDKWDLFKWRVLAFITVQDVFDSTFYDSEDHREIFHQWYFYYEAKYLLIEMILCGLSGFYISVHILERLFLEFNLLQLYYHSECREKNSFAPLKRFF